MNGCFTCGGATSHLDGVDVCDADCLEPPTPSCGAGLRWFCEAHRLWTSTDCPACDAEQIADLERYATLPTCHTCKRALREGESAWASDWKVFDTSGSGARWRTEVRFTCEECGAA